MTRHRAFVSLGSNIRPDIHLPAAVAELACFGSIRAASRVWESPPAGDENQPHFLNGAILLETALTPTELKQQALARIECYLKRIRDPHNKNGPRTIDLDLSLFDDQVLSLDGIVIPDPDILRRAFVAIPLAELDPSFVHPTARKSLAEIAASFEKDHASLKMRPDVRLDSLLPNVESPAEPRG